MPGVPLHVNITPTTSLEEALTTKSSFIVEAIPITYLRSVLIQAKPFLDPTAPWVLGSKGIEEATGFLPTEILEDALEHTVPVIVLSGPSFAQELAIGQPTGLTLASSDLGLACSFKAALTQDSVLIDISTDLAGTQWCGALKNVIALTLGILEGAGYGTNSQALVYTNMVQELQEVISSRGGNANTILSYAGIGDITLTAYSSQSRNRSLGKAVGRKEYLGRELPYTEGINTLRSLPTITKSLTLPVFEATYAVVYYQQHAGSLITACHKK